MKGNKSSRNPSHSILTSVLNCKHQKSSLAKISKEGIYEKMLGGSLRCREAEEPGAESGRGPREAARPRPRAHLPPSGKTDWILCRLRFFAWPYGARFVPRHGVGSGLEAVWLLQLNSAKIRAFRSGGHKTPPSAASPLRFCAGRLAHATHAVSQSVPCVCGVSLSRNSPAGKQRFGGDSVPFCFASFLSSAQNSPRPAPFHRPSQNSPKLSILQMAKMSPLLVGGNPNKLLLPLCSKGTFSVSLYFSMVRPSSLSWT